jgi:hypothetical protein
VKIGFGKSGSAVLGVGSSHQQRFRNITELKTDLLAAAQDGTMSLGESVIVEQWIAQSGLLVTAEGSNTDVKATTKADIGPAGVPGLATFAADFALHTASQAIDKGSYSSFAVASRFITLATKGWLWWKHIVVSGLEPIDEADELRLQEELATEEDYFAVLPGARFEPGVRA